MVDTASFLRYEYERAFGAYLGLGVFHLYFPLHLVCNTVLRLIPLAFQTRLTRSLVSVNLLKVDL